MKWQRLFTNRLLEFAFVLVLKTVIALKCEKGPRPFRPDNLRPAALHPTDPQTLLNEI